MINDIHRTSWQKCGPSIMTNDIHRTSGQECGPSMMTNDIHRTSGQECGPSMMTNDIHRTSGQECGPSIKKVKVSSYIAWYPVHRTAQSALHFTPWQTCSFQGHLNFCGKHSAVLQLHEDYSFTFPPLPSTHLYS